MTNTIKLYRGIVAANDKVADKYIRSTNGTGASDFGKGMYLTDNIDNAKTYGNYVYEFDVPSILVKKLDNQNYLMTKKDYRNWLHQFHIQLVGKIDLGINAQFIFAHRTWSHFEKTGEIY